MRKIIIKCLVLILALSGFSCSGQKSAGNPQGYDLSSPQKFTMPQRLFEISGIAFNNGRAKQVYAIQDENGDLFYFNLGSKTVQSTKFAGKGDYEDVAICRNYVIVLRSDGTLFTFPISEINKTEIEHVKKWSELPKGEYEGLFADEKTGQIFVLTKESKLDTSKKQTGIFTFQLSGSGNLQVSGIVNLLHKELEDITGKKNIKFHPSALAKNPFTKQWFILSSYNKLLVIADEQFKVTGTYELRQSIFNQPEGIAFDLQGNLYISNEGGDFSSGNILMFRYKGS